MGGLRMVQRLYGVLANVPAISAVQLRVLQVQATMGCQAHPPFPKRVETEPPPLLPIGHVLKSRWRVDAQLNKGAFGEVCIAYDIVANRTVAIKSEALDARTPFLGMDVEVLRKLQDKKTTVPRFYACGHTDRINYVVMQLLGRSVLEFKKAMAEDRFSYGTAIRIADQMTCTLRDLHECGYLHRDVKPANFTVGPAVEDGEFYPHRMRIIYMIDFGLCRPYIDPNSGNHYPPRPRTGFRGTPRYASIECLRGLDVGRRDDLWSLFYVLVEIMVGQLPWRRMNEKNEILECKLKWAPTDLLPVNSPPELREVVDHLFTLDFDSTPDYGLLRDAFYRSLLRLDVDNSTPWDWDPIDQDGDHLRPMQNPNSAGSEISCGANGNQSARAGEKIDVDMAT